MSLHQLYKYQKVTEITWIHSHNNPANLMTKSEASMVLKTVINTNLINLDIIT